MSQYDESAFNAEESDLTIAVLRTNLADLNKELKSKWPGKTNAHLLSQKKEIEIALQLQEDYALANRMHNVDGANRAAIARAAEDEQHALADRQLAARFGNMALEPAVIARVRDQIDDTASVVSDETDLTTATNATSTTATTLALSINCFDAVSDKARMRQIRCSVCEDLFAYVDALELECGDAYCAQCVVQWFQNAVKDTSLFPPRCCRTAVPLEVAKLYLDEQTITTFEAKAEELATPNPTYCSEPQCSVFIKPARISYDVGLCGVCGTQTCTTCKGASHVGLCPKNPSTQALLDIASANDWQQCFRCKEMVELRYGCNHMTCRCLAEFCYVCGLQWKTCKCVQWYEERLLEEGRRVAARDGGQGDVLAAVENLRNNHDCTHPGWITRWQRRGHNTHCGMCEAAGERQPRTGLDFIRECTTCGVRACYRCINNRLR